MRQLVIVVALGLATGCTGPHDHRDGTSEHRFSTHRGRPGANRGSSREPADDRSLARTVGDRDEELSLGSFVGQMVGGVLGSLFGGDDGDDGDVSWD